ncbi:MAG: DUF1553 domain-containing protein [Bryobacterales bacterium]|nr:DUF1553 domain-containing protein [Bryobacterales bacterium]
MRLAAVLFALPLSVLRAQDAAAGVEFFETKIRPVLASKCYACHSAKAKSPMGGLALDAKTGTQRVIGDGKLLRAMKYVDPNLQMPPGGKLPEAVVADFAKWIEMGAPDPRTDSPAASAKPTGPDFAKGRKWWAFQPLRETAAPKSTWAKRKHDGFVFAALERAGLAPSPEADRRTLIRRVALNLTGIAPTFAETEAFVNDAAPDAYEKLVERLLASERYGERWGRYWLDVARYGEDNPTGEATNPGYPFAWRYRDWVIEALNRDVPYDRFVKMQLAADQLPGFQRTDLRALGYVGAAPVYHKDHRLSRDVIETLASDDWDERVDAVSRGVLGLTVACARCHDHKFDPISTKDYYAMAGVFASVMPARLPLAAPPDAETERKQAFAQSRSFYLNYLVRLMKGEPETVVEPEKKSAAFKEELERIKREYPAEATGDVAHAVIDAGLWIDGRVADLTQLDYRVGQPRDLPVFKSGNPANTGDIVPRRFLTVLERGEPQPFTRGAGRLDLAEKLFSETAAPLAARVIVNRVWGWHFGKPIVGTPSDFGTQGDAPTHPELLDDLADRFVANGWSLKWLHREILLSATYRQASKPRADGREKDPTNKWLWRMNPRRLDFEAWRDSLLASTGALDEKRGGPPMEIDSPMAVRRSVYAKVSRGRLNPLLKLYDFPDPNQHAPNRELTTTPLQQLFVMNSPVAETQAERLAQQAIAASNDVRGRVRYLHRTVLARDPNGRELDLALTYLERAGWAEYVQALLGASEFTFWP